MSRDRANGQRRRVEGSELGLHVLAVSWAWCERAVNDGAFADVVLDGDDSDGVALARVT